MSDLSPLPILQEDFSPGYRDGHEPNRLPNGATPDGENAWFYSVSQEPVRVTMGRRPGTRLLNPTPISAGKRVDGLFNFQRSGADPVMLAVCNGRLSSFDGVDTFVDIGGGWTGGNPARSAQFKDNIFIADGTAMQRYDGTSLKGVSTAAPTSAPALAAVAGPGVTGTYEGFAVWYDPTMDHESSPSATSAQVVFANQTREWTEPTGAPTAEYTKWRVYVRRVDTNELNFYRAGEFNKGSGTGDETTSDDLRRVAGPNVGENNPPPADVTAMVIWKGFGIGIRRTSDAYVISKAGDVQSWPFAQQFTVDRASGKALTAVTLYSVELLLMQDHAMYRLDGDAVPFVLTQVHPSFGAVSQEAALQVDSLLYSWDRDKGPYKTDTTTFTPLSRGRLAKFFKRMTRSALANMKAGHDETNSIVFWSVPVDGSSRTRVFLPYQYDLDTWLPPMVGLEWSSIVSFTDPTLNTTSLYVGDEWGRVYQFLTGNREGVPTTSPMSTLTGQATAADANTLTDAGAAFYTTGAGLAGMPIAAVSPAGEVQWRRIASNTGTVITLDTTNDSPFSPVPAAGWTYYIGGINWYWNTPPFDLGDPFTEKKFPEFLVNAMSSRPTDTLTVKLRVNGQVGVLKEIDFDFAQGSGAVWGAAIWGEDVWGAGGQAPAKRAVLVTVYSAQFEFGNIAPDAAFVVTGFGVASDRQPRRKAGGA